jgi:hypothetical protein
MPNTLVTDIRHFLDDFGIIAPKSGPARKLAEHLTGIIAESTAALGEIDGYGKVACRRRPGRRPCAGFIESWVDPDTGAIYWVCPKCEDDGFISNWEETMWDLSNDEAQH